MDRALGGRVEDGLKMRPDLGEQGDDALALALVVLGLGRADQEPIAGPVHIRPGGDPFRGLPPAGLGAGAEKRRPRATLRKLLNDQIKITERKNLVQSQRFREALEKAMPRYTNKQITTAEMIAQLLELAKWVRDARERGRELGLTDEETAFYDALAENGSAKSVMKSDILRLMARKLAEMVKDMPKLDWTQRESVRADLRRRARRPLAMYGYPPDLSEDATQLVLQQAELSTTDSIARS